MAEVFSITEIFSTFYEKVTLKRKDKTKLLQRLSQFKENIYKNSNDLEKCYAFFKNNPNKKDQAQLQQQQKVKKVLPPKYEQKISPLKEKMLTKSQELQQVMNQIFLDVDLKSFIISQEQLSVFKGQFMQINKYFTNQNLLPKYNKLLKFLKSDYQNVKQYLSQQSFYTICSIGYFYSLIRQKQLKVLQKMLIDVYTNKIKLYGKNRIMIDYKQVFCGYLKHLFQLIKQDEKEVNIQKNFDYMVNSDEDFVQSITIWLKESLKMYVRAYPEFLKKIGYQEQDCPMLASMINTTHSEPNEDIIKMASHMLGVKIKQFNIEINNYQVLTYGPENNNDLISLISSLRAKPQFSLLLKKGDNQYQKEEFNLSQRSSIQQQESTFQQKLPPMHPESFRMSIQEKEIIQQHSQLEVPQKIPENISILNESRQLLKESQKQIARRNANNMLNESRQKLKDSLQQISRKNASILNESRQILKESQQQLQKKNISVLNETLNLLKESQQTRRNNHFQNSQMRNDPQNENQHEIQKQERSRSHMREHFDKKIRNINGLKRYYTPNRDREEPVVQKEDNLNNTPFKKQKDKKFEQSQVVRQQKLQGQQEAFNNQQIQHENKLLSVTKKEVVPQYPLYLTLFQCVPKTNFNRKRAMRCMKKLHDIFQNNEKKLSNSVRNQMPKVEKQNPLKNLLKKKKCGLLRFFLQKPASKPKSKYTISKPNRKLKKSNKYQNQHSNDGFSLQQRVLQNKGSFQQINKLSKLNKSSFAQQTLNKVNEIMKQPVPNVFKTKKLQSVFGRQRKLIGSQTGRGRSMSRPPPQKENNQFLNWTLHQPRQGYQDLLAIKTRPSYQHNRSFHNLSQNSNRQRSNSQLTAQRGYSPFRY